MDYLVGMIAFYSLINCDTQARPLEKLLIQKRNARRNVVANLAFQSYRGKAWDWTVTTGQQDSLCLGTLRKNTYHLICLNSDWNSQNQIA